MVPGGWTCRACWKSNWPDDNRCSRCKAPRDPQADMPVSMAQVAAGIGAQGRRLDTELPLLVLLVSLPMSISGWLAYLGAALLVIFAVLGVQSGDVASGIVLIVTAGLSAIIGSVWLFVSLKVRQTARWAYAVAAIAYVLPIAPALFGLAEVSEAVGLPAWYLTIQTVIGVIYILLGICAVFLLIISFMQQDTTIANPSTEVDSGSESLWTRRGDELRRFEFVEAGRLDLDVGHARAVVATDRPDRVVDKWQRDAGELQARADDHDGERQDK